MRIVGAHTLKRDGNAAVARYSVDHSPHHLQRHKDVWIDLTPARTQREARTAMAAILVALAVVLDSASLHEDCLVCVAAPIALWSSRARLVRTLLVLSDRSLRPTNAHNNRSAGCS